MDCKAFSVLGYRNDGENVFAAYSPSEISARADGVIYSEESAARAGADYIVIRNNATGETEEIWRFQ